MAEYISRDWLLTHTHTGMDTIQMMQTMIDAPAADVVEEENILKFYYVRSIDEYWIGQRIDNFYYAEYDPKSRQWVWTHSRYLPWGEHIVSPTSLWKEHTYPSEPEEIPFAEWLQGFIKKHAADVVAVDAVFEMLDYTLGDCPCNYSPTDEWLPEVCELQDECPDPKEKYGCWRQFIKHFRSRKMDGGVSDAAD